MSQESNNEEKNRKSIDKLISRFSELWTPEGIQKYVLGTKKNGEQRAIYDVIKDCRKSSNKNNKNTNKKNVESQYSFYMTAKKKNKKKNRSKYDQWFD